MRHRLNQYLLCLVVSALLLFAGSGFCAEQKKITAAASAVLFHIQLEEEALMGPPPEVEIMPPIPQGMWSFSTNQAQMMMRNLIQMRMLPSIKG